MTQRSACSNAAARDPILDDEDLFDTFSLALILVATVCEKAALGGWVTLVATGVVVILCFGIRRHYKRVQQSFNRLDAIMTSLPEQPDTKPPDIDRTRPTAVLMVGGYGGLGIHALLSVQRLFPQHFRNVVFASVGVIDAAVTKGIEEVDRLREHTSRDLQHYTELARRLGFAADYRLTLGTEAVEEGERLGREIAREFPRAIFFMGNLIFEKEGWFNRILHNNTAYRLQRRLQFAGLNAMVLPVRVIASSR